MIKPYLLIISHLCLFVKSNRGSLQPQLIGGEA